MTFLGMPADVVLVPVKAGVLPALVLDGSLQGS